MPAKKRQKQSSDYVLWSHVKNRCQSKNNVSYHLYGGRGIKFCERWNTFQNYFDDMGSRPKGMTLGRHDEDDDFTPENCLWVPKTRKVPMRQQATKKPKPHTAEIRAFRSLPIKIWEETRTLAEWCERAKVSVGSVIEKVKDHGLDYPEAIVGTMGKPRRRNYNQ